MTDIDWVQVAGTTYGWQQLSSVSSAGGDLVGFELKVDDNFPMQVIDAHPVYLLD